MALAILMMLSVAGCGTAAPTPSATPEASVAATVEASAEATPEATVEATEAAAVTTDWTAPFPEPVEIHIAAGQVVNAKFAEGEDMGNNLWTKRFKKLYNVDVIVDWVSAEYDTKLNLAIASSTLPDAFSCNIVQLNQMIEAGLIQDLKGAYESTASNSIKKMMEDNWDIVETASKDGKIYAMPRLHYGYECETSFMWARQDWFKASGMTEIKTIEDFETLMTTFMKNNGAKFGTMLEKTLDQFFKTAASFHAAPKIWVDGPDGSIVYGATLPETKNLLAKWAEWYKKGYVRKDFASLDSAAMLEDANNGLVGTFAQANWAGWQVGKQIVDNQGEGTYFMGHELPAVDDKKIMYPIVFTNSAYNVVRKDYAHPEAMIKLINCYCDVLNDSISNGTMTIDEVMPFGSNDMHHVTGPFKVEFASYKDTAEVHKAFETGVEKFSTGYANLYYFEAKKWITDGDLTSLGRYLQMGTKEATLFLGNGHVDNEQILKSKLWGASPTAVLDYGTTLDDLLIEGYTKIIMGVEPIEYYDTLISDWKQAGGDECTAAINAMYGK